MVDKVSQSLAKLGGEIVTDKVKMVGLPATGETTAALADNGVKQDTGSFIVTSYCIL